MRADRYLKFILTVIALELLWIGLRDSASPALAQQKPEPTQVVITGVRIGSQEYTTLPVAVVGGLRSQFHPAARELPSVHPLMVDAEIRQPVMVNVGNQPIAVQTGPKPLVVDVMPAKPAVRPGLE